jgi:hypothetical protein
VCLILKFHLKFGPFAPADCEIMQVGQQANRPGIVVGLPLQNMYGDTNVNAVSFVSVGRFASHRRHRWERVHIVAVTFKMPD